MAVMVISSWLGIAALDLTFGGFHEEGKERLLCFTACTHGLADRMEMKVNSFMLNFAFCFVVGIECSLNCQIEIEIDGSQRFLA